MALHGEIKVNGQIIGGWSAVRGQEQRPDEYAYDCQVWRTDPQQIWNFEIVHRYDDGAIALAAAILAQADPALGLKG